VKFFIFVDEHERTCHGLTPLSTVWWEDEEGFVAAAVMALLEETDEDADEDHKTYITAELLLLDQNGFWGEGAHNAYLVSAEPSEEIRDQGRQRARAMREAVRYAEEHRPQ
jgi:hypothetical protein